MYVSYLKLVPRMLIRGLVVAAFLAVAVRCADHNLFRNCSSVDYCRELRGYIPDEVEQYVPDLSSVNITDEVTTLSLSNQNGNKLKLHIIGLYDQSFRLIIEEENSTRYNLNVVLWRVPARVELSYISATDTEVKIAEYQQAQQYVVVRRSPFEIVFFNDEVPMVVIEGNKLVMQEKENSQPYSVSVSFPNAHQLYGIHEHCDSLALRNTDENGSDPYRLKNLDVPGYELDSPMAVYGAIPFLYGHGLKSTAGIFLHNAAEQWYDIKNSSTQIMVESAALDIFVFLGPEPQDVLRQYAFFFGTAHMPQLWTLGYHQSRWNYDNQSDVKDVVANFDLHDFQLDAIWLDIEYTDDKKYFTWKPNDFSDPIEMQKNISSTGRKLVTIIDPHIKVDDDYPVYKGAQEQSYFVKNANGSDFQGKCWPGLSSWIDFLNPHARSYYASYFHYDMFNGSTETLAGIWNDMNEPSVDDDSMEKTMPGDALHTDEDGSVVAHRDVHNLYGLLHTMSTHQGLMQRDNNEKRPFILSRSHFAGTQRYSAIWTGDNVGDWGYLKASYAQCLNANILGLVFCGADIGGFLNHPTDELLQRWYQAAAWTPFFRQHSMTGLPRREPYLYSDEIQQVIRSAINLRYKHLPVWYTLFYEHTLSGLPLIRPLFFHYPSDEAVLKIDEQLLVGENILVRAVVEPEAKSVNVYFPDNVWYSIVTNDVIIGPTSQDVSVDLNAIPVYYRGGSIIPRKDTIRRSSSDMIDDCYTIYVNLGKDNTAIGTVYVDDYTSFEYQSNDYNYVGLQYDNNLRRLSFKPKANLQRGDYTIEICEIVVNKIPENIKEFGKYTTERISLLKSKSLGGTQIHLNEETIFNL